MKATTDVRALLRQNGIGRGSTMTGAEIALVSAIAALVALIVVILVSSSFMIGSVLVVWTAAGGLGYYWVGQKKNSNS